MSLTLEDPFKLDDHTTALVEVVAHDPHHQQHQLRTAFNGTEVCFSGAIPKDVTVILLANVKVNQISPKAHLIANETSRGIPRPNVDLESLRRTVVLEWDVLVGV